MSTTNEKYSIPTSNSFSSEYAVVNKLPISIYDIALGSAQNPEVDIFSSRKGGVTLVFNVAAGCGNIPQHAVLQELNARYAHVDDFSILAVVVDDFWCHGYPEFKNGLQAYIDDLDLSISPGQLASSFASEKFGATFDFTILTSGRYDKHSYDPSWIPGQNPIQRMHAFWFFLTGAYLADFDERGIPYQNEIVGWTDVKRVSAPDGKRGYTPLTGNFEKFLISRSGTEFVRYGNGFLLGLRDKYNLTFPWIECPSDEDGIEDYRGNAFQIAKPGVSIDTPLFDTEVHQFDEITRFGISHSLDLISRDIDFMLSRD